MNHIINASLAFLKQLFQKQLFMVTGYTFQRALFEIFQGLYNFSLYGLQSASETLDIISAVFS